MSVELPRIGKDPSTRLFVPRYEVRSTHWSLLDPVGAEIGLDRVGGDCDAVVMLNHVHPERLGFGVRLAAALGCRLLVLCTAAHRTAALAALGHWSRRPHRTDLLFLDWPAPMPLEGLRCPTEAGARSPKHRDVAAKRNLALALARAVGWRRILFLDDDVRHVSTATVRAAMGALESSTVTAVGWTCPRYPDNSVVCHARRLADLPQETFIGAGALAVEVSADLPMFPPVYNEDWLFLYDLAARGRLRFGGEVGQLRFNPFEPHERAREEEFGDLLAEGVFHLLHHGITDPRVADEAYWRGVVRGRRDLVRDLRSRLRAAERVRAGVTPTRRRHVAQALRSLAAAATEHGRSDLVPSLVSFVHSWRHDLTTWQHWFRSLQVDADLGVALRGMGIREECLVTL